MELKMTSLFFFLSVSLQLYLLLLPLSALSSDGILLLSFKNSILSDPLSLLQSWNYEDDTPCSWMGVACAGILGSFDEEPRVIGLLLPNSRLSGSIPDDLACIQHLRHLDLSHNSLNGTLPPSLFNASELRILDLSDNAFTGNLPQRLGNLRSLRFLNLSANALVGRIPRDLASLPNLTVLSLSDNYLLGDLPAGFELVEVLDLSANLVNGSLPPVFGGGNLRSANLSHNMLSGVISTDFASRIPANASLDLSFNNLTGEIPDSLVLQKAESFAGNPNLCGKPLENPCEVPSTLSTPPPSEASTPSSPPAALAAMPKIIGSSGTTSVQGASDQRSGGLKAGAIAGIVVADAAGIGILSLIFVFLYRAKKRRRDERMAPEESGCVGCSCLRKRGGNYTDEETAESETEEEEKKESYSTPLGEGKGKLVTVDEESELDLEMLLKASAYVLGVNASSIVYKAALEDGKTFAVRRIGKSGLARFRDFENQVRAIAKMRHPNLVRIRGFYWGDEEKLLIYDYVPNGNLANTSHRKLGFSSPRRLSWDVRLKIATGVARGLACLHEKKCVHGNLKPSNVLLGSDMEPKISDFGLERLVSGGSWSKGALDSSLQFGSERSLMLSRDSASLSRGCACSYRAPESLRNLKPHPRWDVYSFGILLLELVSGRALSEDEVKEWSEGQIVEDRGRDLWRMADVAIRGDVEGREEALLACFKLGLSCASLLPQKRPSMKEALQILCKISLTSTENS